MKNPKLIVKPFAKNGQKNVIPENYETSMDSNQATWDQGFGQITMLPVAAGGLPPKGQDFNGILNQISENIVYQSQGGRFKFSPEYAESIGGYPKGAILQSDDEKKEYQSLIDNNKVNFNTESNISASWELVGVKYAIKTEVDLALLKKFDKENISGVKGNDNDKVPSLNLFTAETGKLATKAELTSGLAGKQPAGEYATTQALNDGLNQKFDKAGGIVSGKITTESGYLTSKYLDTSIEINSFDQENPHIAVSVDSDKSWSKHRFQSKSGTLAHTSDISDVIALLNNLIPVGASIIWNTSTPIPANFWANEGRSFSATEYPELAKIFTDLRLPDDRGYAIRIADNGRGIDTGREVGTYQEDAIRNITGGFLMTVGFSDEAIPSGAFAIESGYKGAAGEDWNGSLVTFDTSRVVPVANENRMKNVAKILITRVK